LENIIKVIKRKKIILEPLKGESANLSDALLKFENKEPVNFSCYTGMSIYLFLEVMIRNKNDCVLGFEKMGNEEPLLNTAIKYYQGQYGLNLSDLRDPKIQKNLLEKYEECAKKNKILVMPIFKKGHANMMVFNSKLKQLEYYEPHGIGTKPFEDISKKLTKYFKDNGTTKYTKDCKYSPSVDSCPSMPKDLLDQWNDDYFYGTINIDKKAGIQSFDGTLEQKKQTRRDEDNKLIKDPGGFCCMWSFLQMDFRLKHPTTPTNALGNNLIRLAKGNPREFFRNFIRGYTIDILKRLSNLLTKKELYELNNPNAKGAIYNRHELNVKMNTVFRKMWKQALGQ